MILQALHELYERLEGDPDYGIPPPGESVQKVSFRVVLSPSGKLFGIQDAREMVDGKARPRLVRVLGTEKPSGSGLNPCFLWDNPAYMLGFKPDDPKPERTRKSFKAFRDRHLAVEDQIGSMEFDAVCRFLESWDPDLAADHPVLQDVGTGFGVFQIQGEPAFVHEVPGIRDWWHRQSIGEGVEGQCLVTGRRAPLALTHPKIKGVRGAQSSGASVVSFNESAYESLGKQQSHNGPVSEAAAFRYTAALNALLRRRDRHVVSVGDATVAFWTDRPSEAERIVVAIAADGANAVEHAQDEGLREKIASFLRALRSGFEAYGDLERGAERTEFYVLGLSPNAARLSVRFFHRSNLRTLLERLHRHFADIQIVTERPSDASMPPLWLLLRQTGRESKDVPPGLAGPLLHAVLDGSRYPEGLYSAILRRIRADREVNYPRACMIKGYLTRNRNMEVSMSLDPSRTDAPYLLGRLFAALEKTQKDALRDVVSTVRDRFYSSASATPRSVLPRLLRTYQHHLAKLEGGHKVSREKLMQEILDPLTDFPAHLDLAGQGIFAIGYYHQTRDFYTARKKSKEEQEQA